MSSIAHPAARPSVPSPSLRAKHALRLVAVAGETPRDSRFYALNLALMLGHLLVLFNSGAFAAVTLHATGALAVSPSYGTWTQTYYFVSLGLALPLAGRFAQRFGAGRVFVAAMLAMALGSAACAVTGDFALFIAGRVLQGLGGGVALPVAQNLFLAGYGEAQRPRAMALWSVASLSPFTVGPLLGGWMAEVWGWRGLFQFNLPLALLSAGLAWALLDAQETRRSGAPFDWIGLALLAVALACLQTVLNRGQDEDWYNSPLILALAAVGLLALLGFVLWELGERHPLLNLRLSAKRNVAAGVAGLSLSFLMMYGLLSVLLGRLQSLAGYSSFLAGATLVPLLFFAKPVGALLQHWVQRYDPRVLACLNLSAFAVYCFWTASYDFFGRLGWFGDMLWSQVFEGVCLGALFAPLTALFLAGLPARRQGQAAELGGMLRVLGGGVGSPLLTAVWERRSAFHQSRLADGLSLYEPWAREGMAKLHAAGVPLQAAQAKLAGLAHQHAAILGLDDVFYLCGWLFLLLAAVVWLLGRARTARPLTPKQALRRAALQDLVEEP
ncbi:DHA2 family efflux MFS transporter permease subunit [Methylogaea oryzae]|uniref:DHA2 family efflux MFS transporter permease subunit n=1 Tax=Methylogaea oryzae TaxID=1295382 RepID=UPI001C80AAD8|nr:DHA2 family efflux MFS transporter permease subunit [Methylogaea oryzae]